VANTKSVLLVLIILISGIAVGALAGYRMHLTSDLETARGPVTANFTIEWPDGSEPFNTNITVDAGNATALRITQKATEAANITLRLQPGAMGVYVFQLGEFPAEGRCGWIYFVGHEDNEPVEGDRASDLSRVFDNGTLIWRWGCV
jgi:archaellum component FlaG (FlaF/FlaG flagellin family)